MKLAAFVAVALLAASPAAVLAGSATAVAKAGARTPVERIVTLLKDVLAKTEQDGENEEKIYNKFACWCDKSLKLKADAIDQARADLRSTGQEILKLKGMIMTRTSEIEDLSKDIKENVKLQDEATAVRQKVNAKFMAESTEMKQTLAALQEATLVLVKGSGAGASLLQAKAHAGAALSNVLQALPLRTSRVPEKHLTLLSEFMQSQDTSRYAPQSATIQGILKDMYDTFSADLEDANRDEATENRDFEALIAEKTSEKLSMEATKKQKEAQKADYEQLFAENNELYDSTDAQMKADMNFFDQAKASCLAKSEEWNTRKALRAEEVEGIKKAMGILSSDEARELFAKSIKPGKEVGADESVYTAPALLQVANVASSTAAEAADKAYGKLKALATGSRSLRLAQLAVQLREAKVGHFDAVVKAIDDMINTLKDEETADIEKRDQCKEEYAKIDSTVGDLEWKIERNEAKIAKLERLVEKLTGQKEETIEQIGVVNQTISDMTAQRTEENAAFLQAKSDDEGAIKLLSDARDVLTKYYKKNAVDMGKIQGSVKGAASLQQEEPEFEVSQWQAPDATFSSKGKRKGESKDIVSLMTMLIEDLTDEIRNGMDTEKEAQLLFEKQLKAAETLREELVSKKVDLEEAIANHESDKGDEEGRKNENEASLGDEKQYKASIKPDCDWILGAFEGRAERRAAEFYGLRGAKDYLAGATLLQRANGKHQLRGGRGSALQVA